MSIFCHKNIRNRLYKNLRATVYERFDRPEHRRYFYTLSLNKIKTSCNIPAIHASKDISSQWTGPELQIECILHYWQVDKNMSRILEVCFRRVELPKMESLET